MFLHMPVLLQGKYLYVKLCHGHEDGNLLLEGRLPSPFSNFVNYIIIKNWIELN